MLGSEKKLVESYTELLSLDSDLDRLYNLLNKENGFLTKKNAKEFIKFTFNLDPDIKKSIDQGRSRLFQTQFKFEKRNPHVKGYPEHQNHIDKSIPPSAGKILKLNNPQRGEENSTTN